jgi:hypothetical protein
MPIELDHCGESTLHYYVDLFMKRILKGILTFGDLCHGSGSEQFRYLPYNGPSTQTRFFVLPKLFSHSSWKREKDKGRVDGCLTPFGLELYRPISRPNGVTIEIRDDAIIKRICVSQL